MNLSSNDQNSYPALDFVLCFACAWLIGVAFHRFSGDGFLGAYPYAGSAIILVFSAIPVAWSAATPLYRAVRFAVPLLLLTVFAMQGSAELGIVGRIQDRVGGAHLAVMFLATFFAMLFTKSAPQAASQRRPEKSQTNAAAPAARRQAAPAGDAFDRIIGQPQIVAPLKEVANLVRSGIRVGKKNAPHAVLLFLGPTGVGKTEAARALAQAVFGREDALIRFDMGQFTDSSQSSRFYGPPPGYVGSEEGGQLTRAVLKKPKSVVLLDEVEKAHPQIWDAFLPVFDEGYIVDGSTNQKVDMTGTIIVLTSNLLAGSEGVENLQPFELKQRLQEIGSFRPELIGRINEVLVFNALSVTSIAEILRRRVDQACWSLSEQGISIFVGDDEIERLVQEVREAQFGVRQIDDVVRKYLRGLIAERQAATPASASE